MNARTIEELHVALNAAIRRGDATALMECARECDAIGTPATLALAAHTRGQAEYFQSNFTSALELLLHALQLQEEIGNLKGAAFVHLSIANVYDAIGDNHTALGHNHRGLSIYQDLGDNKGVAMVTSNIGNQHKHMSDYPTAMQFYYRATSICEELDDVYGVAINLANIGAVYTEIGSYPSALEHLHRSLALFEDLDLKRTIAGVTGNIGIVYAQIGDFPKALEHFLRAKELFEELGDRNHVAAFVGNVGSVYESTGDLSKALECYRTALDVCQDLGNQAGVFKTAGSIISVLISLGSYSEAEALLVEQDAMVTDDADPVIDREQSRALIQEHHGMLDEATQTLSSALEIAKKHTLPVRQAEIHSRLRDICQKRNDFAGYIEHNNEYTRIKEEINGKETTTKLTMQEAQREIAKERAEHEKHLSILYSTLPKHIADRVSRGETVNDHYDNASVIFLDIVGFTAISERLSSAEVVQLLDGVFTALDVVCKKHDVVKIKTIGDSYMAVAFPSTLPHFIRDDNSLSSRVNEESVIPNEVRNEVCRAANAALDMLKAITDLPKGLLADLLEILPTGLPSGLPSGLQVRIGLHSGPVTAGIIGTSRMQYDVWGDTVNVASRMESTSEPGRIHVSEAFAIALNTSPPGPLSSVRGGTSSQLPVPSSLRERGALEIKGKGVMQTYWLEELQ